MRLLLLIPFLFFLAGCAATRTVEVEQGNPELANLITEIEGKSKINVRQILGPPQTRWTLDNEIWLYYHNNISPDGNYTFFAELHFDEDGNVAKVTTRTSE